MMMQRFRGTPGYWYVDDNHPERACLDIKSETHGDVYTTVYLITDRSEYDAQLISAAPELLEALQDFMSASSGNTQSCGHDFECICRFDKAKAAIAKALGK